MLKNHYKKLEAAVGVTRGGGGRCVGGCRFLTAVISLGIIFIQTVDYTPAPEFQRVLVSAIQSLQASPATPTTEELLYGEAHTHLAVESLPADRLAPLTREAQRLIYNHQHPTSCEPGETRFAISHGNDVTAGLGSIIHISTTHLSIAMELNRVLIWSADVGQMYVGKDDDCEEGGTGSFLCFFLPPSNCTLMDAMAPNADTIDLRFGKAGEKYKIHWTHVPSALRFLWENDGELPVIIDENTLQAETLKYWYRGQAAAYLMRFNQHALREMKKLRTGRQNVLTSRGRKVPIVGDRNIEIVKDESGGVGGGGKGRRLAKYEKATYNEQGGGGVFKKHEGSSKFYEASEGIKDYNPFPFPDGTINLHIRHGDKGIEMDLVPTSDFLRAAEEVVFNAPIQFARQLMFLSTEDDTAVTESSGFVTGRLNTTSEGEKLELNPHWTLTWYDVPRNNVNGMSQLDEFTGAKLTRPQLTRIWWLQLLMALECDAWVGARGSNWNRLIDELRCIWVPKCNNPFYEVGFRSKGKAWFYLST